MAVLKSPEICRTVFPLNKCGSKQVMVSLDPASDFAPVVTIGRTGWSGIRLSPEVFLELTKRSATITKYFEGETSEDHVMLSFLEKVEFHNQWGKRLICINTSLDKGELVFLAKSTWESLVTLFDCILHVVNVMSDWQYDVMNLYVMLAKRVKDELPQELLTLRQSDVSNALEKIGFDSLKVSNSNPLVDLRRCFYELQATCADEICAYLPCV